MKFFRSVLAAGLAYALVAANVAQAASLQTYTGPGGSNPTADYPVGLGTINQVITAINSGVTQGALAGATNFRNVVDNGNFNVQQVASAETTCGGTTGSNSANTGYFTDRWIGDIDNATATNCKAITATSSPTPPVGFTNEAKIYRKAAALTTPHCLVHEIPSNEAVGLQGQQATLSAYLQSLSSAVTGNTVLMEAFYGTVADEGLAGTWSGVLPPWTGVTALGAINPSAMSSTAWNRYSTSFYVPTTALELGVAICFTPAAESAGTTDGIAMTGAQLEAGPTASTYETKPQPVELAKAQRYDYVINELAAGVVQTPVGNTQGTTTTCTTFIPFPVPMRSAPTYTNALGASTFKLVSASQTATALSTPFSATLVANSIYGASINFTTTGMTAKDGCFLVGAAGTGVMNFFASF